MNKKILIVLSSHALLGESGKPTGWWLSELTHFYDVAVKAGLEVDIASPKGGEAPMDPTSLKLSDPVNARWFKDEMFLSKIKNTIPAAHVRSAEYAAIFYPGGHGPMYDLASDKEVAGIAQTIYEQGGVVSAVCHGPAALLPVMLSNGEPLLKEHRVTGLSNLEEYLVRKARWMPFLLETELRKKAAGYTKALLPGFSHVVVSGRLVTGQNPRSAKLVAREVVRLLR
jgi:putative intracellular protease/amidase